MPRPEMTEEAPKEFFKPREPLVRLHEESPRLLVADLLRALGEKHGWSLENEDVGEQVARLVRDVVGEISVQGHLLNGKRIEGVFAYVLASLGFVAGVSEEGAGEVWLHEKRFFVPDWRVTLRDGKQFLVEVKNVHHRGFSWDDQLSVPEATFCGLEEYARLSKTEFAVRRLLVAWWKMDTRQTRRFRAEGPQVSPLERHSDSAVKDGDAG